MWLVEEEKATNCKFIRPRGRFKRSSYTGIDYTCSQNRHFPLKLPTEKSSVTEDSEKAKYHCTAQILAKEFKDHVEVLYFKRHYKHDSSFNSPRFIIRRKKTIKNEKKMDNLSSVCKTNLSTTGNSPRLIIRRKKTIKNVKKMDNITSVCKPNLLPTGNQYSSESDGIDVTVSQNNSSDFYVESLIRRLNSIHSKLLSKTPIDVTKALKISDSLKTVEQLIDNDISIIKPSYKVKKNDKNYKFQQKKLCTLKEMQKSSEEKQPNSINTSVDEIFISTSSANDHDYDKI